MASKAYMDYTDIMKRYDIGETKARRIIRTIQELNDGGMLPVGKVLPSEVELWENTLGGRMAQNNI
jgi:hypothetical protein